VIVKAIKHTKGRLFQFEECQLESLKKRNTSTGVADFCREAASNENYLAGAAKRERSIHNTQSSSVPFYSTKHPRDGKVREELGLYSRQTRNLSLLCSGPITYPVRFLPSETAGARGYGVGVGGG